MKILVFVLVFFWSITAQADEWTGTDSAVQVAVYLSLGLDYLQTRQIIGVARADGRHQESNPIMGHKGQRVPAEVYFLTCAALHTGVAYNLPQPYRRLSQVALVAFQGWVIEGNLSAGYGFEF